MKSKVFSPFIWRPWAMAQLRSTCFLCCLSIVDHKRKLEPMAADLGEMNGTPCQKFLLFAICCGTLGLSLIHFPQQHTLSLLLPYQPSSCFQLYLYWFCGNLYSFYILPWKTTKQPQMTECYLGGLIILNTAVTHVLNRTLKDITHSYLIYPPCSSTVGETVAHLPCAII